MIQKLIIFYISLGIGNTDFSPLEEDHDPEGWKTWMMLDDFYYPSRDTGRKLDGGKG